jgi:hypothetical protein
METSKKNNVMKSQTETGFGARLQKARELANYISNFDGFNPPKPTDQADAFTAFVTELENANASVFQNSENYRMSVSLRQNQFTKGPTSLLKLASEIRSAVIAVYGKKSKEVDLVNEIIRKIRGTKLMSVPKDPNSTDAAKKVSQSEQSYGSMTQHFQALVVTISEYTDYSSSKPELTIAGLQQRLLDAKTTNSSVSEKSLALSLARKNRRLLYEDLEKRRERIRNYVLSVYGKDSKEYGFMKKV